MGGKGSKARSGGTVTSNLVILLQINDFPKIEKFISQNPDLNINEPLNQMGDTALHFAVFKRNKDLVRFLLNKQADPYRKNDRDLTPIDVCKTHGHMELLELFQTIEGSPQTHNIK